jgi:TatD DNase family protein
MLEFADSHCHLHTPEYYDQPLEVLKRAKAAGINRLICVGTDAKDSRIAIQFATEHKNVWASVGLHPHAAKGGPKALNELSTLVNSPKVVAIGECGLDYYYLHSNKIDQIRALRHQLELALKHDLPVVFHVRAAEHDFWPIFDDYKGLKGVFHSFSTDLVQLDEALARHLYIGLNGIVTFSKNDRQLTAFRALPLNKMMLETDAPYLTPVPFRGKINEPKNIVEIAEFLSKLRAESLTEIATATNANIHQLFGI